MTLTRDNYQNIYIVLEYLCIYLLYLACQIKQWNFLFHVIERMHDIDFIIFSY